MDVFIFKTWHTCPTRRRTIFYYFVAVFLIPFFFCSLCMCVECFLFASKNNNKTDRTNPCVNVFSPKLCQFCSGRRSSAEVNTQHNTTWWPCFAFQITAPEHLYNMVENLCFRFVPPTPSLSLPPLQPLFVLYTQRTQRLECPYFVAVFCATHQALRVFVFVVT